MNDSRAETTVSPVEKSIDVPWDPATAFERFTSRMADWWPIETHSLFQDRAVTCAVEPRVGGRIYESSTGGEEADWGTVTEWEPPRRLAFTWHPGRSRESRQEVEVTFTAAAGGTRVRLVHSGWERIAVIGEDPGEVRSQYDGGWDLVLGRYRGD